MARWNDLPWREDVYEAAELWKTNCLLDDRSLTGDPNVWTLENLQELQSRISDNPDWSKNTFEQKLFRQLNGASIEVGHLASEILWLIYLFPLGNKAGDVPPANQASTKLKKISKIRGWVGLPPPTGIAFTPSALSGIGRIGMYFKKYFHAIRYLLVVSTEFKQLSKQQQTKFLAGSNAWEFARWSDQFKQETQVPMRHALLFFLFPDNFERMVSLSHKREIVADLSTELTPSKLKSFFDMGGFDSLLSIDQTIFAVRKQLEKKYGTVDLDFYRPPIDGSWGV